MEIILIILTGTLLGAFNLGFFMLGYHFGTKKASEEGIKVNEKNAEFINEMMNWRMYGGGE